ncbi:MAG: 30S ribosomal protein S16 [Halobacteriovorax sp.]|nr:30S ribosomal protein S16 [Halobacteriovorax sp.]|tara:strand:+ start:37488 stop:37739 length:252 start_codon:yes stop_codon:yes gene_type:complete
MLSIRLSRGGRVHRPVYTIVAADSRRSATGKFLEKLGRYEPQNEEGATLIDVKADRIQHWVSNGAQLSDTVKSLLKRNKITLG